MSEQLSTVLSALERIDGPPPPPNVTAPLDLILWENVGYLIDDKKRALVFDALRTRVGLTPEAILAAPHKTLYEIACMGGMRPEQRVDRLRSIAATVLDEFAGDLSACTRAPLPKARKGLGKFPGIGIPSADKILMFAGTHPVLGLDSNALRVLVRYGFAKELKDYSATYRAVQAAIADQLRPERDWLVRAHQLLRRHGQEICRRTRPACHQCALADSCEYYAEWLR